MPQADSLLGLFPTASSPRHLYNLAVLLALDWLECQNQINEIATLADARFSAQNRFLPNQKNFEDM